METISPHEDKAELISHDCGLIMEAIRRLIEGTWHLQDDDQIYSWELFPKIRDSLHEHVAFEEASILPTLSPAEQERHRADHRRLLAQLWSVERALADLQADYFQDLLRSLQVMLEEHHHGFSTVLAQAGKGFACSSSCHAEEQIFARSQRRAL